VGRRIAVVISGGNVDRQAYAAVLDKEANPSEI